MNFHILTLFPEMIKEGLNSSILKRASEAGYITVNAVDIRDYSLDKHKKVDDYPYGGGAGMLMQAQPVFDAYKALCEEIRKREESRDTNTSDEKTAERDGMNNCSEQSVPKRPRVLFMTPQGRKFDQTFAKELSEESDLIFLCGHYEGIDERVIEEIVTDEVSLGDFVLTGGELPAMVMTDCISRLIPGVLGSEESAEDESFSDGLLEYPQYTRPEVWRGKSVPPVLLSGNHKEIEKWRTAEALKRTKEKRPDMYEKVKEELDNFKTENPRRFRKERSEAEDLIKMRELKSENGNEEENN